MELNAESGPATPLGSIKTSIYDHRVAVFLRKVDLSPPELIPRLAELPALDFQSSDPSSGDTARGLLVQQRISEPGYRQPETQKRRIVWSKERKEAKYNEDKWVFNKNEAAKAFDTLLSRAPLAASGVAQALLSHASVTCLDELWCHLHDPKLEKRMKSRFRRSRSSVVPEIPWLDDVTRSGNTEYIRLMCQVGLGQEALDRALSVALSMCSMDAIWVLLSFGAVASACQDAIRERVKLNDLALVRLLLSAPHAMSVEAWRYCMEPQIESLQASEKQSRDILLLCLAHRPMVASGTLLLKALQSQNSQATAMILAYVVLDEDFFKVRQPACDLACLVQNDDRRHKVFAILAEAGFLADDPILRGELMRDVKSRHFPLIQLLADFGISLDIEPHNAMSWAVSQMDLDVLMLLKNGTFSSPISLALDFVPDSASESDMLQLVTVLAPRGLAGAPLHKHLVRAVQNYHIQLVEMLLSYKASIEYEECSSVCMALRNEYFDILNFLLQSECSPKSLSATIPTAMALQPRPVRLKAMKALLKKGIMKKSLGVPLQMLVCEQEDVDSELIQLLLDHKAPIDEVGNDTNNAILVATQRGNLSVLKMLCDAEPQIETLSRAAPIAFSVINTCGYDVALDLIRLLLQRGAAGVPIHQTLLTAAEQDYRLDFVRVLIENGADANYATGSSFAVALKTGSFELLEMLCMGCPPSRTTTETVLFTAIDPQYYSLQALDLFLGSMSSPATALNASWASEKFRRNPNIISIVPCLLRHGLGVDLQNGAILCLAVRENNPILLSRILSAHPSIVSLTAAFRAAIGIQPRSVELEMMRLLLEAADSAEIGQSESLLQQTHAALADDFEGLQLILRHKASVDFDDGRAVQVAAAAGSIEILSLLLLSKPLSSTVNKACLAAAASSTISRNQRERAFHLLLFGNFSASVEDLSKVLADSVSKLPDCTQLPEYILARGVEVQFGTLKMALGSASRDLFIVLASSTQRSEIIVSMFRHVRAITMTPDRRYWIYQYLLGRGIPSDDVSEALLDSLGSNNPGNLPLLKLLLQHGAAVGYQNCAAISLALGANSLEAIKLLNQYVVDDNMAGVAFELARKVGSIHPHVRIGAYRCFLQWNISTSSVYSALVENFNNGSSDISVVKLLVVNGADPNEDDAHCFLLASKMGLEPEFRALSKYAKLGTVLRALLKHFQEEWQVVWWLNMCLEEQSYQARIDQDDLLFECMSRFPRGVALLELLLDSGGSASAQTTYCLCPGWKPELCTAMIWALFSKPRIENDVLLALLRLGGNAVLQLYSTPVTKVSAAFGCLLDKTRTPILEALLDMDRDEIMNSEISGVSLAYLGAYPNVSGVKLDFPDKVSLPIASLFLGNVDAFRLMKCEETPDNGMLHTAAFLALPKFVDFLLETHDPNHKSEEFSSMIPLAVVCTSKPHPWCKIANSEADWYTRQKETMCLLAPGTNLRWKARGKTVLHFALENGVGATKAMIEALDIRHDLERDEKYLYMDRDGVEYSPDQWIIRLLDVSPREKEALIQCLTECHMASRYFRRIGPDAGEQPKGFQGLPPAYAELWHPPGEQFAIDH
ncbi:hypothetical protein E0Z10_g10401 [Xylaria hypoxylon]|uniref:Uncharacterized protein n=1 Tax=Xylaria hypoxylon TaxID=37992 RepID=A0A4Z0YHZ2_9PEZI|nr:hypothetical protein E0Z10_g10401 [Xylaria hypoxylon]